MTDSHDIVATIAYDTRSEDNILFLPHFIFLYKV